MNIPGDLIIIGIVVVFLMLMVVVGVDNTLPVFARGEFDVICNRYLAILQTEGGLSQERQAALRDELMSKGFSNIQILTQENVEWGKEGSLTVTADYIITVTNPNFTKVEKTLTATYSNKTIVMTLNR